MEPTITDWISSIAALIGVPGAIAAFIILFLKDKTKQAQIDRLANIAEHQQVIASEMQQQTFKMREANEILEKQFSLQETIFLTQRNQEEQNRVREEAQEKIKQHQHKNDIKPYLKWVGNGGKPDGKINIDLKNTGKGEANKIQLQSISGDAKIINVHPNNVGITEVVVVTLQAQQVVPFYSTASFQILYEDVDGNRYYQQVDKSSNNRVSVSDPVEILQ